MDSSDLFVSDEEACSRRARWDAALRAGTPIPWYANYAPGTVEFIADVAQLEPAQIDRILSRQLPRELEKRRAARASAPAKSERSPERDAEREWRRAHARAERVHRKLLRQADNREDAGDERSASEMRRLAATADREAAIAVEQVDLWRRVQRGERVEGLLAPPND